MSWNAQIQWHVQIHVMIDSATVCLELFVWIPLHAGVGISILPTTLVANQVHMSLLQSICHVLAMQIVSVIGCAAAKLWHVCFFVCGFLSWEFWGVSIWSKSVKKHNLSKTLLNIGFSSLFEKKLHAKIRGLFSGPSWPSLKTTNLDQIINPIWTR